MSRSQPQNNTPNPASRWFEWNGEAGTVRYYDKNAKKSVDVGADFTFLLLDQLGTVGGWHDPSASGIYANEVRDTRRDPLVVKAFKGGTLIEGIYQSIKDRVHTLGGQFVANCYLAYKRDGELAIGAIRFKGAALGAWMEFEKAHRGDLYAKAITITGFTEGKKGRIVFRVPTFKTTAISDDTQKQALGLDVVLQEYLTAYLARTSRDQAEATPEPPVEHEDSGYQKMITDEDIPF